jgi:hypothetical protein
VVARDRFDYSAAIGESWKRQLLLNIVKLRYAEPPIFVEVGQIVTGYSIESSASIGGVLTERSALGVGDSITLGGTGKYIDRPTITYLPMTGNSFLRGMMTPISPAAVFEAIQARWSARAILMLGVSSMNGLANEARRDGEYRPADAGFLRAVDLIHRAQGATTMTIKTRPVADGGTVIVVLRKTDLSEQQAAELAELRMLLGLPAGASQFHLAYGDLPETEGEFAVLTRSLLHIMTTLAGQIDVPPEDIASGRTYPNGGQDNRLVTIQTSPAAPTDAFTSVAYRNKWFYIEDTDLTSKATFTLIMLLSTLASTPSESAPPMITIPAQ